MCDFNLSKICILCLSTTEYELKNVLSKDCENILIVDKIEFLISSELLLLDQNNPESICSTCENTLNAFYIYKQSCLENNRRLKYFINNSSDNELLQQLEEETREETSEDYTTVDQNDNKTKESDEDLLENIRQEIAEFIQEEEMKEDIEIKEEVLDEDIEETIHLAIREIRNRFLCYKCDKSYKNKRHLHRHLRLVHKEGAYRCTFCSKIFDYKIILKNHMRTYSHFQCSDCKQVLPNEDLFKTHLKLHEMVKIELFECNSCGNKYSTKKGLNSHLKAHSRN